MILDVGTKFPFVDRPKAALMLMIPNLGVIKKLKKQSRKQVFLDKLINEFLKVLPEI